MLNNILIYSYYNQWGLKMCKISKKAVKHFVFTLLLVFSFPQCAYTYTLLSYGNDSAVWLNSNGTPRAFRIFLNDSV